MNRLFLLLASLLAANAAWGELLPARVTVYDEHSGQPAFTTTTTSANGTFATNRLAPGNYVVKFMNDNPSFKANSYAVVISSGAKKVVAVDVPGAKFGGAGVAMRVQLTQASRITGQLVDGRTVQNNLDEKVRVIAGVRYRWMAGFTGSNIGPHWVEENTAAPYDLETRNTEWLRKAQDVRDQGDTNAYNERRERGF